MRGKHRIIGDIEDFIRITPADAGKTFLRIHTEPRLQDHPRGCGENLSLKTSLFKNIGSPPRMRGKRPDKAQYRREDRITPADAGKTKAKPIDCIADWDHPRGCGENR